MTQKVEVKISIKNAYQNRNNICALGGYIAIMNLKINRKEKITKRDLRYLRKFLRNIDKYDQTIWKQAKQIKIK